MRHTPVRDILKKQWSPDRFSGVLDYELIDYLSIPSALLFSANVCIMKRPEIKLLSAGLKRLVRQRYGI